MQNGDSVAPKADLIEGHVGDNSSDIVIGKDIQQAEHLTNIYGHQFAINDSASLNLQDLLFGSIHLKSELWERVIALLTAGVWIGLVGFLVIRNEPLDANLFVLVRIILSVMAGVVGAVIPGILMIGIQGASFTIRAGGALALFVISYFFTPTVIT